MRRHGGRRPGSGRPRTRVIVTMPRASIRQLEAIAKAECATAETVAQDAILGYIAEWREGHTSEESEPDDQ